MSPSPELAGPGWSVTGVHHVAFAHRDARVVSALEGLLGLHAGEPEVGPGFAERMVEVDGCALQLLESTGVGVVETFLERRGPALHHVALRVDSVELAWTDLAARGVTLVDAAPRPGGQGTRVGFIHPREFGGLLVELVEVTP
jgi:methylmalonyl-CoA/ethylmalonyl-CoA epimerase